MRLIPFLLILALLACGDSSDTRPRFAEPEPEPVPESQLLLERFGSGQGYFNTEGMQGLLDFEDEASPVVLLQLISVVDADGFAVYEAEADTLWQAAGAQVKFASTIFAQLVGDRGLVEVRAIEFPHIGRLLDSINGGAFTEVMDMLFAASDDHAWVLGIETEVPFEPSGAFFDPDLLELDREQALDLLQLNGENDFNSNAEVLVDMVVSDSPGPFYMVNLIDFYEQANYADGRETGLTGMEANQIYGNAIAPRLVARNSGPEIIFPISVVLTAETVDWQQAVIVRYASRDAFLNIFPLNVQAPAALVHKAAGVENTLVYATEVAAEVLPAPEAGFLYNFRYCEVLLGFEEEGRQRAAVYNSLGLGMCPQEDWDSLDAEAIGEEFGADAVFLNGIRYWVLDLIESTAANTGDRQIEQFGDIRMRRGAFVEVPEGANIGSDDSGGYVVSSVSRDTIWHYRAGRQVYELQDPDGRRYMMQSFSQEVDREQTLQDLQFLGRRLDLPPGWTFSTRILAEDFELPSVNGIAEVVTDEFRNTYQRVP